MSPAHTDPTAGVDLAAPDVVDEIVHQWSEQRPELPATTIGVFGRIARLNSLQRTILQEVHERHGLTLASFDVLANLRRSGAPHRKTAGELAESSLLTSGGITFRLDKMENDGLIKRVRSKDDRRVVYAEITPHGLEVIDAVFEDHVKTEQEMLGHMSAADIDELCRLLRSLGHSLAAFPQPDQPTA